MEQAVIVKFNLRDQMADDFLEFDEKLDSIFDDMSVGEYDGYELDSDQPTGLLYFYGEDADKLLKVVQKHVSSSKLFKTAVATVRYGEPDDEGVEEKSVQIV
jgi:hypothetical protein